MTMEKDVLDTPETFPFPFIPYDIQTDFMRALFRTLEDGKLGIFESPTGTGKSMSMICGALSWFRLREERRRQVLRSQIETDASNDDEENDDWFNAAVKKAADNDKKVEMKAELRFLEAKDLRLNKLRKDLKSLEGKKEVFQNGTNQLQWNEDEDDDNLVKDYYSDDEDEHENESEEEVDYSLRIYFCSRTHSQLTQFVKEVQKSPYNDDIRLVSLASRTNMCINESVRKWNHSALINEKCLDLQKNTKNTEVDDDGRISKRKKTAHGSCPFYRRGQLENLKNEALFKVQDIEELVSNGRKTETCPYYGSRMAAGDAEIVVVPYNTILHKSTREACGIKLKNSVVIIDEAHNLLETLTHIHSSELLSSQLSTSKTQLKGYLNKYRSRLKAKNLLYIKQIIFIITNLIKFLEKETDSRMISVIEFMNETQIFNINIYKLVRYISKSKIAYKLRGFADKEKTETPQKTKLPEKRNNTLEFLNAVSSKKKNDVQVDIKKNDVKTENENLDLAFDFQNGNQSIHILSQFLERLIGDTDEGRILVSKNGVKFLLLNPSNHFRDLVKECRSIVVAGGTMEPIDEFKTRLFVASGCSDPSRIVHFSCGHVIPETNLLPLILLRGPTGQLLDFSYSNRNSIFEELLRVLTNLISVVPGGMVVFFPSYDYENKVYEFLLQNDGLAKIQSRKRIFRESKGGSVADSVLKNYSRAVKGTGGAVLFSVVGGKMSEGINFSDDLGRCVVMVGMPYPNSHSPELKEKMQFLDRTEGPNAGRSFYENCCMKAVNQSIGRAIRHRGDYSAIVLLDRRYDRRQTRELLPGWIRSKLTVAEKFGPAIPMIRNFFKSK